MATVNLGKVGLTPKGEYDPEITYQRLDFVTYQEASYVALTATTGHLPTDSQYWQLLAASNPNAIWKANTKEDEGYVEKGEGNEDKVWATDSEGNPAWREYSSDPAAIIDTNNWNSQDFGKIRLVAEVTVSPYEDGQTFQRVDFSAFCNKGDGIPVKGIFVGGLQRQSLGSDLAYLYRYSIGGMYSNWGILYKSQTNQAEPAKFYLCIPYSGPTKITIYDFHKTEGITNVEWIFDQNKYLDTTQLEREEYEYYGYTYQESVVAYYPQPTVSSSQSGIVPSTGALTNNIFSTDSRGAPKWQTPSALDLPTNTEVDTKIAEAITAANVPEFVERETVPSVEEAEKNKFYLVKNEDTEHYDIYALLGDKVERIDDTTVDLTNYVTKEDGKGLSTEDFTAALKAKLDGIEDKAQVNTIESISVNGTKAEPDEAKNVEIKAYNEGNKPEVGGRNLVLDSDTPITNSNYLLNTYTMTASDLKDGDKVTVSLKGILGEGKTQFGIYNSNGNILLGVATPDENGYATMTAEWRTTQHNNAIQVYTRPSSVSNVDSTIEWIKLERGEIPTDWSPAPEDLAFIDEQKILAQIANRTYQGTDLTVKFKSEIDGSFNGNPWAWIQDRINNANWDGLHVCDYIPIKTSNNVNLQAQIAGIDTYRNYGLTVVGHHIDFICRELWPTLKPVNPVNYNNGISTCVFPWLASDLYHWLNSLSGSVPNAATVNPTLAEVDYTKDGVYYFLPANLKAVIVEKHLPLAKRYSASGLLDNDNVWDWQNIGKLWCPTECEVYGMPVWGGKGGYSLGGTALQYPIFAGNMNRVKYRSGSRYHWWLLSPGTSNSTDWCYVTSLGLASNYNTSYTNIAAPVCFRIASTVKSADMPVEGPEMMDEYMQSDEALSPEFEKPIDPLPETEDEPLTE